MTQSSSILVRKLGLSAAVLTCVYCAACLIEPNRVALMLWLRIPLQWQYLLKTSLIWLAYLAGALLLLATLHKNANRHATKLVVCYAIICGIVMQFVGIGASENEPLRTLIRRHTSLITGGYWSVGIRINNLSDYFAQFAQNMPQYPIHPSSHPPGLPLVYWVAHKFVHLFPNQIEWLDAWLRPLACFEPELRFISSAQLVSALLGAAIETLAAFATVVPLYLFTRRLASRHAGWVAILLYPLVPGVVLWASQFDRTYPFLCALSLWLCELMAQANDNRRAWLLPIAIGGLFFVGTFLTFGLIPLVMACGIYTAVRIWQREQLDHWRIRLAQLCSVVFSFGLGWFLCVFVLQFDLVAAYRYGMTIHLELVRPYWPFVFWNGWDALTFIGLAAVVVLCGTWRRIPALACALCVPIFVLCVLHLARGETGRLWMFFAPIPITATAIALTTDKNLRTALKPIAFFMALLALQSVIMINSMRVMYFVEHLVGPDDIADAPLPAELIPVEARWDTNGAIRLLGYTTGHKENNSSQSGFGQDPVVTLYWRLDADKPSAQSYKVFVGIAPEGRDDQRVFSSDAVPMRWWLPTTCWRPGQIVRDQHILTKSAEAIAAANAYSLVVGLYGAETGHRVGMYQPPSPNQILILPRAVRVR